MMNNNNQPGQPTNYNYTQPTPNPNQGQGYPMQQPTQPQPIQSQGQVQGQQQQQPQQQQSNDVLQYVGYFMGSQPKNSGVKKDGTPWESHDVMFYHTDMTKPVRFTWFGAVIDSNNNQPLVPNQVYRVMYNMNEFVNKMGQSAKSKKAFKIVVSSGDQLGYQQSMPNQPQGQQQSNISMSPTMQQTQPQQQPRPQKDPNNLDQQEIDFVKDYMANNYPGDRKFTDPCVLAGYYLSQKKPEVYARFVLMSQKIQSNGY